MKVLGVSHPKISVEAGRIQVSLAGVKNVSSVKATISAQGNLYFRPVLCGAPLFKSTISKNSPSAKYRVPSTCPSPYRYSTTDFKNSTQSWLPQEKYIEDTSYGRYPSTPRNLDDPTKNAILALGPGQGIAHRYVLGPSTINGEVVTEKIIKKASAILMMSGQWVIAIDFTSAGSTLFNRVVSANYHQLLANDLDGSVLMAPVVEAQSFSGSAEITDNFSKARATQIAAVLNSGPLPVPVKVTS